MKSFSILEMSGEVDSSARAETINCSPSRETVLELPVQYGIEQASGAQRREAYLLNIRSRNPFFGGTPCLNRSMDFSSNLNW